MIDDLTFGTVRSLNWLSSRVRALPPAIRTRLSVSSAIAKALHPDHRSSNGLDVTSCLQRLHHPGDRGEKSVVRGFSVIGDCEDRLLHAKFRATNNQLN